MESGAFVESVKAEFRESVKTSLRATRGCEMPFSLGEVGLPGLTSVVRKAEPRKLPGRRLPGLISSMAACITEFGVSMVAWITALPSQEACSESSGSTVVGSAMAQAPGAPPGRIEAGVTAEERNEAGVWSDLEELGAEVWSDLAEPGAEVSLRRGVGEIAEGGWRGRRSEEVHMSALPSKPEESPRPEE